MKVKELPDNTTEINPTLVKYKNSSNKIVKIPVTREILDKEHLPTYSSDGTTIGQEYEDLPPRRKLLVDGIALGATYTQLYDEYFNAYEHNCHMKDRTLRNTKEDDIANKYKAALVATVIRKQNLGKYIQHRRKLISDIYIEQFRKTALNQMVSKEFLTQQLLQLKEKIKELPLEKQINQELKLYTLMDKVIEKQTPKDTITNIQINNNIPAFRD